MIILGNFVGTEKGYREDPEKIGRVPVRFMGETRWARPFNYGPNLWVPSLEWIDKYKNDVWAVLSKTPDGHLVLMGVAVMNNEKSDEELQKFLDDYPHINVEFTENWKFFTSDKKDFNETYVKHTDGTKVIIDRTSGEEHIQIYDAVHGTTVRIDSKGTYIDDGPSKSKIILNSDGVKIETPNDVNIEAKGKINLKGGSGAMMAGVITGRSIDPFTMAPHRDASTAVLSSKL